MATMQLGQRRPMMLGGRPMRMAVEPLEDVALEPPAKWDEFQEWQVLGKDYAEEHFEEYYNVIVGNDKLEAARENMKKFGLGCAQNNVLNALEIAKLPAIENFGGSAFIGVDDPAKVAIDGRQGMNLDFQICQDKHAVFDKLRVMIAPNNWEETNNALSFDVKTFESNQLQSQYEGLKNVSRTAMNCLKSLPAGASMNGAEMAGLLTEYFADDGMLTVSQQNSQDLLSKESKVVPIVEPFPDDPTQVCALGIKAYQIEYKVKDFKNKKRTTHETSVKGYSRSLIFGDMDVVLNVYDDLGIGKATSGNPGRVPSIEDAAA